MKTILDNLKEIDCLSGLEKEKGIKALIKELETRKPQEQTQDDKEDCERSCEIMYATFWSKLNIVSKEYLISAKYHQVCLSSSLEEIDCSPIIIQYGRTVENEFKCKIYDDYVFNLCSQNVLITDDVLAAAVRDYKCEKNYFLPAKKMNTYFTYISKVYKNESHLITFRECLLKKGINTDILSDKKFTDMVYDFLDTYRSPSAHSGQIFIYKDSVKCQETTKKILKNFLKAIP